MKLRRPPATAEKTAMKLFGALGFPALLLVTAGIISNCSVRPKANGMLTKREREPRAIGAMEQKASRPEYRLGFGDVIEVKFFNNDRFNETVAVRPDGRISIEKLGDIAVAGMTPMQLDTLITTVYAKFLRNPEVTVIIRQFGGYQVYVLGEVNKPGGYPLQRDMTILQALAEAGGPKDGAKLGSVVIMRRGEQEPVQALKVDLAQSLHGAGHALNRDHFQVQAQDVIYVSKTFIANTGAFLKQVYDGVLPPLDIYLRSLWWNNR